MTPAAVVAAAKQLVARSKRQAAAVRVTPEVVAVIIYGLRDYGRVDAHAGEYAQTRFFHIGFAPLVPTGSTWVTGPRANGTNAHGIKLHARSVVAAYLRGCGPLIAVGSLIAGV